MAELILYHHVLGLTDGVRAFADQIRAGGHTVHLPDLFEGATPSSIEEGVAHAKEIGGDTITKRADEAAASLPAEIVYGGFSLGSMEAQRLVQTRPGALGALFYHGGDVPVSEFGTPWPESVPLQIHASEGDGWLDRETVDEVIAETKGELFVYPGNGHLFTDSSWKEYDEASTKLVIERTLEFLGRVS